MSLALKATSVTKSIKKDTAQNSPDKAKSGSQPLMKATGFSSVIP